MHSKRKGTKRNATQRKASKAQHSTAKQRTAQRSTAEHSTTQHNTAQAGTNESERQIQIPHCSTDTQQLSGCALVGGLLNVNVNWVCFSDSVLVVSDDE